uniref:Uncharacterized protein n=1 Tax=Romanomermis culicivorax TaxID=13658 RepID=A0A915I9Y2_ROMCU
MIIASSRLENNEIFGTTEQMELEIISTSLIIIYALLQLITLKFLAIDEPTPQKGHLTPDHGAPIMYVTSEQYGAIHRREVARDVELRALATEISSLIDLFDNVLFVDGVLLWETSTAPASATDKSRAPLPELIVTNGNFSLLFSSSDKGAKSRRCCCCLVAWNVGCSPTPLADASYMNFYQQLYNEKQDRKVKALLHV